MITKEYLTKCYDDLQKEGIWSDDEATFNKNFLKWSLRNHPDKNLGKEDITKLYQTISGCRNDFLENFNYYTSVAKNPSFQQQQNPTFRCPYCGASLSSISELINHMNALHRSNQQKKAKKSAPKKSKKAKKSAPKKSKK